VSKSGRSRLSVSSARSGKKVGSSSRSNLSGLYKELATHSIP
jgi:hypothetical protein